jgi:hypothetical protein
MNTTGYFQIPKRTLMQRLLRRLFPSQHLPPIDPIPEWARGESLTQVRVRVDWRDRLRLLVSGRACIDVRLMSSADHRRAESRAAFYVAPPGSF